MPSGRQTAARTYGEDAKLVTAMATYVGFAGCLFLAEAQTSPDERGIGARADAEFGEHGGDVVVDGATREEETTGDLGVLKALHDETKHLEFPNGEAGRIRTRRRSRTSSHSARP